MGIRDIVSAGRYQIPARLVPAETLVRDPQGRFSFEIPWPWFEWEGDPEEPTTHDDCIVLLAPRTADPWPEASIWPTEHGFELDKSALKSESKRLARTLGGVARRPRRLLVGEEPAAALFVQCGDTVTHQVTMVGREVNVVAVFRLPLSDAAGYEVHVETMLATWQWQ